MNRALMALCAVPLLGACTAVQSATNAAGFHPGEPSSAQLLSGGAEVVSGGFDYGKCSKLGEDHVSLTEERSLGGALAIAAALRLADLRIVPTQDSDPEHLRDFWKLILPAPTENALTAEVAKVGTKLAALSTRPELPWTFAVLDDPSINAFSTPGGYVLVSRGLLERIHSENALAGVLAHEISHVTQRHAIAAYLKTKVEACQSAARSKIASGALRTAGIDPAKAAEAYKRWVAAPAAAVNFDLPENFDALAIITDQLEKRLVDDPLPAAQEFEADRLGLDLMVRAGYAPESFVALVGGLKTGGGSGNFVAHHPEPADRVRALDAEMAKLKQDPLVDFAKAEKAGEIKLSEAIRDALRATSATADTSAP